MPGVPFAGQWAGWVWKAPDQGLRLLPAATPADGGYVAGAMGQGTPSSAVCSGRIHM